MRRKVFSGVSKANGLTASLTRPLRGRMQCSSKILVVLGFIMAYVTLTLFLAGMEHNCPSLEDLIKQEENRPIAQVLQRIEKSVNESRVEIQAPLVKMGVNLPITAPPAVVATEVKKVPTAPPKQFAGDQLPVSDLLRSSYAPNNVFYVWCGRRWFEFPHYLSVMSVIRTLRPDNIIFFYNEHPVIDSWTYNTWFEEIRQDYPFFRLWPLDEKDRKEACSDLGKANPAFIRALLTFRGGVYVHENTILADFPNQNRSFSLIHSLDNATGKGFMMAQKGLPLENIDEVLKDSTKTTHSQQCTTKEQFLKAHVQPNCVNTAEVFYPKDIWDLDDQYGRLIRRVFYGDSAIRQPEKSYDELIPNIAHIVWLGGGQMDFLFYLCVLSLIYVAEVDMVYIHGDAPPIGMYWERIKDLDKITTIYRDSPATVFGNKVEIISHVTDVWRVDFMVKYGGIYVDTDTVFIKPLDREIRAYEAVGAYDWTYWNHPFPDTINFGVAIGKRNAKYWHEFQKSMKWFMDKDWSWNGLRQPYRIKERHPELVRIDPALQVICFEAKCHPTWWPNYHNESIHHLNSPSITNWRNDTYAFHWTLPTPDELLNEENLVKSDSMFAEIGQYILKKAGRLHS